MNMIYFGQVENPFNPVNEEHQTKVLKCESHDHVRMRQIFTGKSHLGHGEIYGSVQ